MMDGIPCAAAPENPQHRNFDDWHGTGRFGSVADADGMRNAPRCGSGSTRCVNDSKVLRHIRNAESHAAIDFLEIVALLRQYCDGTRPAWIPPSPAVFQSIALRIASTSGC